MKCLKLIFIITGILIVNSVFSQKEINTLAVLPFEDAHGKHGKGSGKTGAEIMTSQLVENEYFGLIERMYIEKLMKEQGFGLTGAVKEDSSIKIGELLGAKYIMLGKVTLVESVSGISSRYKKCCILGGCLTAGCLGGIVAVFFPTKGYRVGLSVRIVNAKSGVIVFTYSETDEDSTIHEALQDCSKTIVKKINKKFDVD